MRVFFQAVGAGLAMATTPLAGICGLAICGLTAVGLYGEGAAAERALGSLATIGISAGAGVFWGGVVKAAAEAGAKHREEAET